MLNFQHKNSCEGHQRSNLEWLHIKKINVTRRTIYVENFILVSETAQGWYYAALLYKHYFDKNIWNDSPSMDFSSYKLK